MEPQPGAHHRRGPIRPLRAGCTSPARLAYPARSPAPHRTKPGPGRTPARAPSRGPLCLAELSHTSCESWDQGLWEAAVASAQPGPVPRALLVPRGPLRQVVTMMEAPASWAADELGPAKVVFLRPCAGV